MTERNQKASTQSQDKPGTNANGIIRESSPQAKHLLTIEQQIAHMKDKGITFETVSEEDARAHLRDKCQFFRIYAYRKLFDKHVGGERDGQYVNLDFGNLVAISNLDRMLRDALLPMALDVEHFAKVRLLSRAETNKEDGCTVMRDYFSTLKEDQRNYIDKEIDQRRHDSYAGAMVEKYGREDMPLWVFCEVVSFGAFLGILKFCSDRWYDKELSELYYCLRLTKSVRNACAHGACIINDLSGQNPKTWRAPVAVTKALAKSGVPKRLRAKWLKVARVAEICTLIWLYANIIPNGLARSTREKTLSELFKSFQEQRPSIPAENPAMSSIAFVERLTRGLGLID